MLIESIGNKHFRLFANCIPVKGASRSIICDLQRGRYHFITNDLFSILNSQDKLSIADIVDYYGIENREIINDYFTFLESEEYIFFCDFIELDFFPKLDLTWDNPSTITNAIIDTDYISNHDYPSIFKQLDSLGCNALQLRFFCEISIEELSNTLRFLDTSSITSIELFLPYSTDLTEGKVIKFANEHLRVNLIVIHSYFEQKKIEDVSLPYCYILFTDDQIKGEDHCGFISKEYFSIGIESFTEAQSFNSCLNRKISIDKGGFIKNCPSMISSFGHIQDNRLEDILLNTNFTDVWNVNKDQIDICNDCEFRYICTDCRAITIDNLHYSKPLKCSYDPYNEIWENVSISTSPQKI